MYANSVLGIIREKLLRPRSKLGPKCQRKEGGKGWGERGGDRREK